MYCKIPAISKHMVVRCEAKEWRHTNPHLADYCPEISSVPTPYSIFANQHAHMTHPMNQLCALLGMFTETLLHHSNRDNHYGNPWWGFIVTRFCLGIHLDTHHFCQLSVLYNLPAMILCMWYIGKCLELGHCQLKLATGNHEAKHEVLVQALVHLAQHHAGYPEAPIPRVRVFLFNMDPTVVPYSLGVIVCEDPLSQNRGFFDNMWAGILSKKHLQALVQETYIYALQLPPRLSWRQH